MKIDKYGSMVRQGSDLDAISSVMVNLRVDNAARSQLATTPGYKVTDTSVAISTTGNVTRGKIFSHKDEDGDEYIFMISGNDLYYLKADHKWYLIPWAGHQTADFDQVWFWVDRGTLHIGAGPEGIPAVYEYLEREDAEHTGYFGDAAEDLVGYFWGNEELPQFIAEDNFGVVSTFISRMKIKSVDALASYADLYGLDPDKFYHIMGQFVFEGGQVSIPSVASSMPIIPPDLERTAPRPHYYANVQVIIPQVGYDRRLVGVDIYVAEVPDTGIFSQVIYPNLPGINDGGADEDLTDQEFASLPWKWLQRLRVSTKTILYQDVFRLTDPASPYTWLMYVNDITVTADVLRKHFSDGIYNTITGGAIVTGITSDSCYAVEVRPQGGGDWEELIFQNISSGTNADDKMNTTVETLDKPATAALSDYYDLRVVQKWHKVPASVHYAYIQIRDYSGLNTRTVTINGTALVEDTDWAKGSSNYDAALSLATAIVSDVANVSAVCSSPAAYYGDYQTAYIRIEASVAMTLSTNDANDDIVFGSRESGGGFAEAKWATSVSVRRPPSGGQETGDAITVAQPYSLTEEYYPKYGFAASQDGRTFFLDCFLRKRYRNWLMWSERNKPQVVPNKNYQKMNTFPGEEARGLVATHNAILALFERSVHVVRMTGEPVQYDAEESKVDVGCISAQSVVEANGIVYWFGFNGIKRFADKIEDLTENNFKDDYKALIANHLSFDPGGSYEDISGGYCAREELIIWTLPSSQYTIDSVTVRLVALDLRSGDLILLNSAILVNYFASILNGGLYAVGSSTGIYDWFSTAQTEAVAGVWLSGVISSDNIGMVQTKMMRIRYKGTVTVELIRDGSTVMNAALGVNTSLDFKTRQIIAEGEEIQIRVTAAASTSKSKIGRIELKTDERLLT